MEQAIEQVKDVARQIDGGIDNGICMVYEKVGVSAVLDKVGINPDTAVCVTKVAIYGIAVYGALRLATR